MRTNNVENFIGQLATKVLQTNNIGANSPILKGMDKAPQVKFDIFFRQATLTIYDGTHDINGNPNTETIETPWGMDITEEDICNMIDKVNKVADLRRKRYAKCILDSIEEAKKEYERIVSKS